MSAVVRIGTQGWTYPDWIGTFYPPGSKSEEFLPFYGGIFDTVELDTTFYHAPRVSVVRAWARRTPQGFRFAAKVPKSITHSARLIGAADQMGEFVRSLEPLGEKRGPLLVQLPAEFVRDSDSARSLDQFLASIPAGSRVSVEFRHRSWHVPETYDLLRAHGACVAWTQWRDLPPVTEVTADFLYIRWLGIREDIKRYDRVQVDRGPEFDSWEAALKRVIPEVREVFGYFNNHWAGHSPASANEMKRRLGLAPIDPTDQWRQRELW